MRKSKKKFEIEYISIFLLLILCLYLSYQARAPISIGPVTTTTNIEPITTTTQQIIPEPESSIIKIIKPENTTYYSENIVLEVLMSEEISCVANSFDNGPEIIECYNCSGYSRFDLTFSKGTHKIRVFSCDHDKEIGQAKVVFTIA